MIIKDKFPISQITWISSYKGSGFVEKFYEPESVRELLELCQGFYANGLKFDIIGHTSNTLYTKDYVCERMVSTRKLKNFEICDNSIICECGTSVRQLSLAAIEKGIKGFEGTIDLPGTVASALYGHATCYGSDISSLLLEAQVLTSDGMVQTVGPSWFDFKRRSSVLKRGEKEAVILTVMLSLEKGDPISIKAQAEQNHTQRRLSQPEAKNSLGSLFVNSNEPSCFFYMLSAITKIYGIFLRLFHRERMDIESKRRHLFFLMLGASDIEPYVCNWGWYQWRDEKSHDLFWKFVRIRKLLFKRSIFEIEIKHN